MLIVVDLTLEFCSTLLCRSHEWRAQMALSWGVNLCAFFFNSFFKNLFDGGVGWVFFFLVTRREIGQRQDLGEVLVTVVFARNSLECVLDSCGFPSLLLLLSLLFFANLFAKFGCFFFFIL